ncbi:hypothetical protein MMYC01_206072 [Madurella mycetomatis]|uniref:BTB domain-containing protein n=1 Tax=Madurella mycetomatis TaxID=100816 RepID=A0A175W0Z9_9PEZI|nr:hypothetical protein MMYC01_206072 [Madurella mycetomatis]
MYDYTVDPEGDVILTLSNPNVPFAIWSEDKPLVNGPPAVPVTFRVSSRHLILASPVFKAALTGGWKEGIKAQNGCLKIGAEGWDVDAMLIAMNIIHCRMNRVPFVLDLEMVAKLAVLVDYYQLHDAFYSHKMHWISALKNSFPRSLGRELMLWMCIAWVFDDGEIFTDATHIALQCHTGYLQTLGLPIPSTAIGMSGLPITVVNLGRKVVNLGRKVELRRSVAIAALVGALHELMEALLDNSRGCSFECRSILLGALRKQLHGLKVLHPEVEPPFQGCSLEEAVKRVEGIKDPVWCSSRALSSNLGWDGRRNSSSSHYYNQSCRLHSCSLKKMIEPHLHQTKDAMTGLNLSQFKKTEEECTLQ